MALSASNKQRVNQLISKVAQIPQHEVDETKEFFNDLAFDSLDSLGFIMYAEHEFNITIPDEKTQNIKTVGEAYNLIDELLT